MRHLISSPSRLLGAQRQRSVLRRKLVGALAGEEADAFLRAADVCAAAEQVPARSALCRLEHSTMTTRARRTRPFAALLCVRAPVLLQRGDGGVDEHEQVGLQVLRAVRALPCRSDGRRGDARRRESVMRVICAGAPPGTLPWNLLRAVARRARCVRSSEKTKPIEPSLNFHHS